MPKENNKIFYVKIKLFETIKNEVHFIKFVIVRGFNLIKKTTEQHFMFNYNCNLFLLNSKQFYVVLFFYRC